MTRKTKYSFWGYIRCWNGKIIFWLKCLILDRRLYFFPITAVLLRQYKFEQHHVIAANVYLLSVRNLQIWRFFLVFTVLIILLMDVRNIISFANIKKPNYLTRFDEIWNCYFLLNLYVTRFPENQSESESRIVRLIGKMDMTNQEEQQGLTSPNLWPLHQVNRFLGSSA